MAAYTAIADVSESLVELLRSRIECRTDTVTLDASAVDLVAPSAVGADSDTRLGLSLYSVTENPTLGNADRKQLDETRFRDPPLALDLGYLLTAYPGRRGNEQTATALDQQRVLGLGMQILSDAGTLDAELVPSETDIAPQITVESIPTQTLTGLFNRFPNTPFAPSVGYHVGPVLIDSAAEEVVPQVTERLTDVGSRPGPS